MRAADYVDEILGSFRKQRLRTALTSIGIGISALTITLMVGLGQGLQTYIETQFLAFADERVLMIFPGAIRGGSQMMDRLAGIGRPAERLDEEAEQQLEVRRGGMWISETQVADLKALPGVESVAPMTWLEVDGIELVDAPPDRAGKWQVDMAVLDNSPLVGELSAGRMPATDASEVLLAPQYALAWGIPADELLGRSITMHVPKLGKVNRRFLFRDPTAFKLERKPFTATIVGLAEKSPISRAVYLPLGVGREVARFQSDNPAILSDEKIGFQAHLRIREGHDIDEVRVEIEKLDLVARSVGDGLDEIQKVFLAVDLVLASFGLLALVVATLGIINTLLMAITERTREIGVMKALGMTQESIRMMFALEAAAIGLVGGIAGTLLSLGLGLILNVLAKTYIPATQALEGYEVFYFPWWLLLGAPLFSSLIGGVAGIYPANRAARLDPIRALHHD